MHQSSRRLFTEKDDEELKKIVQEVGEDDWDEVAERFKKFNARQCKERYNVYLKREYRTDPWTHEEDDLLVDLYGKIGPKWIEISQFFNGRHSNSCKNRWHRYIQKKFLSGTYKRQTKPLFDENDIVDDSVIADSLQQKGQPPTESGPSQNPIIFPNPGELVASQPKTTQIKIDPQMMVPTKDTFAEISKTNHVDDIMKLDVYSSEFLFK